MGAHWRWVVARRMRLTCGDPPTVTCDGLLRSAAEVEPLHHRIAHQITHKEYEGTFTIIILISLCKQHPYKIVYFGCDFFL